jgi:hypothetical protein
MPKELNYDEDGNCISEPHLGTYIYNTNNTLPGHYGTGAICEHVWWNADARLIAAAPEMLALLKRCLRHIDVDLGLVIDIHELIMAIEEN